MQECTFYMCSPQGVAVHLTMSKPLTLAGIESMLQGSLEVIQLDEASCLLINADARELMLPKNLVASKLWFERHFESGQASDFVLGPVIHCQTAHIAHLNHLQAQAPRQLSDLQRVERAALIAAAEREQTKREEAQRLCVVDNPQDCAACGS